MPLFLKQNLKQNSQGDLMHWVPVLNHFDAFFETHVAAREDEDAKKKSFPAEPTRWIVRASCVILENCANKHVYDSCEHLGALLSCDDAQVALDALRLLAVATRRAPGSRGNRFRAPAALRSRLLALCSDLPDLAADAARAAAAEEKGSARSRVLEENEEGDEEVGAVRVFGVPSKAARADEEAPPRRAPRRGGKPPAPRGGAAGPPACPPVSNLGKVQFAFYCPGGEDELLGDLGPAGRRAAVADRAELAASGESDRAAAARLAKTHGVPSGLRFSLFARVRLARLESSADPAEACRATLFRLMAFVVLLQVDRAAAEGDARGGPDESAEAAVAAFLAADQPELVAELFRALRYERAGVPKEVVEACLRALAALAGDRARAASTLAAMRGGGHPAILAALVSSTARRLIEAPRAPVGEALTAANLPKLELDAINADADAPVPIADALVALLSTLVTTHGGCLFLRDVSLLPALLPLLRNRNPRHVHVVSHAVHVLEIFMDYASQAAAAFRDLGGMQIVVQRLKHEAEDALAEHAATHGPRAEPSAAAPSESEGGVGGASEASAASPPSASPPSPSSPPEKPAPTYLVSSTRRVLLKALMRALALTNFSPGTNNVKVAGLEDGSLCAALNLVFRNPRLFGAGVFSLAANLLCDVMNHEPTCYPELEKQEVPQTFLAAWEGPDPGPSPSADALCCLPNALGALCLSPLGLARVKKSAALDALVAAFTSRAYQRAMHGETAGAIGGNIDELLRHVPDLQPAGVRFAIDVLRRLLEVGGMDPGPPNPEPWPDRAPSAAGDAEAAAAPMETDAAARAETSAGAAVAPATTAAATVTATTDAPMDPSSVAVSVDMTSHMTRAAPTAPPVSAYFLAEAVANVSRLIDSMLPTDECAETFVRRGGVALLIRLHAMPFLPDSFSTSSACHALSVTLRSFAGRSPYSPILVSQTQDALTQCVRAANENVERAIRLAAKSDSGQAFIDVADVVAKFREDPSSHGSLDALLHKGVPKDGVADALRDVARVLTVTQSVLNLTTSLLRSSPGTMPGLLNELGDGGEGAAAVKEWKPGGLIDAVSYAHRNVEILGGILAESAEARDAARQRVAERTRETRGDAETSATETDSVASVVAATASAMRSIDQECVRFRASYNYFCSSLVKNVANARHRASAETVAFLRVPVAELAARLSAVVADVVDGVGGAAIRFRDGSVFVADADTGVSSDGIARRRLCGLFETLHAILIDERRRCSQGLVLNYMDRCLGVERAREAFEALWRVAEDEAGAFVDEGESSVEAKGKAPRRRANVASSSSSRKPSVDLSTTTAKGLPTHVAAALRSATSLLLQLVDVDVLFGSSGSAANVVAPAGFVPTKDAFSGLGTPSYPPPSDPRVFAARLHANLAPAVLAAWRSKALSFFPGEAASHLMSALVHLGKGTEKLPERVAHHLDRERLERERSAGRASRGARSVGERLEAMIDRADREARGGVGSIAARPSRPPPPPFTPSPSMTASIAEMGFSEAQARAALVAVRGRSIELAMDWLFSHPNEARIADEEAAAAAAAPPAVAAASAGDAGTGGGAAAAVDGSGAAVDAAVAAVDVATTPAATPAAADPASPADAATPPAEDGDAELVRALQMSMRDEEEVDAEVPAAPEKPDRPEKGREDEPPKETAPAVPDPPAPRVALPRPDELLEPILALSRANPSMAYSGAKLLARELRRAPADVKRNTMEMLVAALATDDETDLDLAVRLLVLVLVAEPAARRDAFLADAPSRLLERLERFLAERKKLAAAISGSAKTKATADDAADDAADTAAGALAVTPGWATGSFLALHKLAEWRARLPLESARAVHDSAAQLMFREKLGVPGGYLDPSTRAHFGRGGWRRAGGDAAARAPDQGPRRRRARARRGRRRLDSGPAGALRLPRVRRARGFGAASRR